MQPIRHVGIVGAGTMGRRIAFSCIANGIATRLYDVTPGVSANAVQWARDQLAAHEHRGDLPAGAAARASDILEASADLADCVRHADLALECVPEDVELKRAVFSAVDRLLPPDAMLATNTSAIPGSMLADATGRPEKIFNVNFGHIEHRKVEVMAHPGTAPAVFEAALAFVRTLGLVPIAVRGESVGYATNRIWRAVKKEVLALLDRGAISADDVDRAWMLDWGTPIGPCGLMDKIGLDVVRDIELVYYRASGDASDRPPPMLIRMIADGKLGEKSGEGFYRYPGPAYEQPGFLDGAAAGILEEEV